MLINEIVVRFHGFHPSEFTRSYVQAVLEELREEAPYGAIVRATFSRHHEILKGVVQISSAAGSFFAVASGSGIRDVNHQLMSRLRRRFDKWKHSRFLKREEHHSVYSEVGEESQATNSEVSSS